MNLTEHFTLDELTHSQNADRLRISNAPDPVALANLRRVAAVLEQVRALFGVPLVVSSGYRGPELNAATPGSSKTSAHVLGLAADFTVPGYAVRDVCHRIMASAIEYDQLIFEGSWVHLGLSTDKPRRQNLTANFGGPRTTYTLGIK